LGVLKFAAGAGLGHQKYDFITLDYEPAWDETREALIATYDGEIDVSGRFEHLDLSAGAPWVADWSFADSDLFTLSFCLSEVWSFNTTGSVSKFLDRLISEAKSGAIFCYVDNGGDNFTPLVESELGGRADLRLIGTEEEGRMLLSSGEQCNVVEDNYRSRFGQRVKLTGNVALRVWQKI
jgi:hypothetical protein